MIIQLNPCFSDTKYNVQKLPNQVLDFILLAVMQIKKIFFPHTKFKLISYYLIIAQRCPHFDSKIYNRYHFFRNFVKNKFFYNIEPFSLVVK